VPRSGLNPTSAHPWEVVLKKVPIPARNACIFSGACRKIPK
jgi:hypothetical protein